MGRPPGTPQPPLSDSEQCTATSKQSGNRCGKRRRPGLRVCEVHGGKTKASGNKVERELANRELVKQLHKLDPIPENDIEANPMESFLIQYRMTIARIRYIGEKVKQLHDENENDLVWGTTKQEVIGASEFDGVNTTYEAKLNVYLEWEMRERHFAHDMQKTWINAKLDTKRLEIEAAAVERFDETIVTLLRLLGKDPFDVEVRRIVRESFAVLGVAS